MGGLRVAVCVPTRACVHTGAHVFRASVGNDINNHKTLNALDPGHTYLAELFRQNGYATFATGKWHNDAASFARSFGEAENVFFGGMDSHFAVPVQDFDPTGAYDKSRQRIGDQFSTDLFGDAAIRFLERQDGSRPFFLYCAFTAPHDPRTPPQDWAGVYRPEAMHLPANFAGIHPFDNGDMWLRDEMLAEFPRTAEDTRRHIAEYYGMISDMDEKIGEMLAALSRNGLAENTIIVYTADHGLSVGQHGLLGKQNLYEHSMRCPLVIRGPRIPQGSTDAFTYLFDLFPTLLGLASAEAPPGIDGRDLAALWSGGGGTAWRQSLFLPYRDLMRSVRDERYKLIVYPRVNHRQLFDLADDPDELRNLAADPAHRQTLARLEALLEGWRAGLADPAPLSSPDSVPLRRDLTGQEREPDRWQPQWIVDKYFDPPAAPDPR